MNGGPDERTSLRHFGLAACDNVLALVEEAELLDRHRHLARSYVLSVLAAEELSKALAAFLGLHFHDDPEALSEVEKVIKGRHPEKIQTGLFMERVLPMLYGQLPDGVRETPTGLLSSEVYEKKNRAMYVDLIDGQPEGPDRIATDVEAQNQASSLRRSARFWAVALRMNMELPDGMKPPDEQS